MKITVCTTNGMEYENSLNDYWDMYELLDSIEDDDGWLVISGKGSSMAFKKEQIVWMHIEVENVDEFCEMISRSFEKEQELKEIEGDSDE